MYLSAESSCGSAYEVQLTFLVDTYVLADPDHSDHDGWARLQLWDVDDTEMYLCYNRK